MSAATQEAPSTQLVIFHSRSAAEAKSGAKHTVAFAGESVTVESEIAALKIVRMLAKTGAVLQVKRMDDR